MVSETVVLDGHIIDSLTLPKALDQILSLGGSFEITDINIGSMRSDASRAAIRVEAPSAETLDAIVEKLRLQGVTLKDCEDAVLADAPEDGVFPDGFYSTTNLETFVRYCGRWRRVDRQEMDVGIRFDNGNEAFTVVPMADVKMGDRFVVGHKGVRVTPLADVQSPHGFRFMSSTVSTEKPAGRLVCAAARRLIDARNNGQRILFVLGPAVVHTGGADVVAGLIDDGWVNLLFAGNALAAHDIESSLFGTSLGVSLSGGNYAEHGTEHHLRAINLIRKLGGIRKAVDSGTLTSGIMYSCVKNHLPFVLAGSIRDDGPLPEVVTNVLDAQNIMRDHIHNVGVAVVAGTLLHGVATGNILPGSVPMICVDTNPSTLTKFTDRGSFQCMGIVMDSASFFGSLAGELKDWTRLNS